jgi:hypothetical protein
VTTVSSEEEAALPFRSAIKSLARHALEALILLARGRIHQPVSNVGTTIRFADGTTAQVYRETVVDGAHAAHPATLVVGFRLRHLHGDLAHALFRLESELNTVLFAGFPGLVSKLWLRHDQNDLYRGIYEWDGRQLATAYVRALWWALALVSERSSIHYAIVPSVGRDEVLADPAVLDVLSSPRGTWWRPVSDTELPGDQVPAGSSGTA